jgi:intracellular multiplication protein IcmP
VARASSHQAGGDGGAVLAFLVIIFGLGFGCWLLWQEEHALVSSVVMRIFYAEIRFIHLFTDRFDVAGRQLLTSDPSRVKFDQLVRLGRQTGRFFLIPAIALVLTAAGVCLRYAAPARFCRSFNLEGLMREQARSFRSPAAFSGRRLGLVALREGEPRPADASLSAQEWVARWAMGEAGGFDEHRARDELMRQLGGHWLGPQNAPSHVKCMLWAIGLHLAARRADALAFLGLLSESLRGVAQKEGPEGPASPLAFPQALVKNADAALRTTDEGRSVCALAGRHGFVVPGVMSALVEARRQSGVLAPAQLAFLKLVDRRLWYALHSLGSPADAFNPALHPNPCVEAIGARGHWAAECIAGGPLLRPSIDRALAAIRAAATAKKDG